MTVNQTVTIARRNVLKTLGATVLGVAGISGTVSAVIDDSLDLDGGLQEVLVTFDESESVSLLNDLSLEAGYHAYENLPVAYTKLTGSQIGTVGNWDETRAVVANAELDWEHDDARRDTNAGAVHDGSDLAQPYTGENVHAVVVDTGIDASHPDLEDNVVANYQWVGDPLEDDGDAVLWEDAGLVNTDDVGHGTHCAGSIGGDGTESDGEFRGMAPDVDLTSYSVNASLTVQKATAAYDHIIDLQRAGEHEVHLVSNSYGQGPGEFDPYDPLAVAMWFAMEEGILTTFSAGNDGDEDDEHGRNDSLGIRKQAPYVLSVAATDHEQAVTGFSSRGDEDGNHDRHAAFENVEELYSGTPEDEIEGPMALHRPGVAAKGEAVMSTLNPVQPLWALGDDDELWYGLLSGTSMSNPVAAGCAALAIDAYIEHNGDSPRPIDVIATLETTADEGAHENYTTRNVGAGYVDALAATERAESGNLATVDEDVDFPP